jgi:putative ABC transport system substrate-binding protein
MAPEMSTKQLQILQQVVPRAGRVAVLWNVANPTKTADWREVKASARTRGWRGFAEVFAATRRDRPNALLTPVDPVTFAMRASIAEFTARERLPAMYPLQDFVEAGGLISYGADIEDLFRRAPRYVDRILKGTKPADLPVEQATEFDLVINLKTARALGLTIPPSLLQRADQVIE